jgi:hypothetical protein
MSSDIHPQFQQIMDNATFVGKYIMVVGSLVVAILFLIIALDVPARMAHMDPAGVQLWQVLLLLLFWGGLMAAGRYLLQSTTAWLRRATAIYQRNSPVPMLLSTGTVADFNTDSINDLAHLQPLTPDAPLPALSNIRLLFVRRKFSTRFPVLVNAQANVFVDNDPTGPIVIKVGDQLWCSARGYNRRIGSAWYFRAPTSWRFLRRRISGEDRL